jgi:hypothetical protein
VLKYLTGYTHRVALSNHRLVSLEDDRVTFIWKDYSDGCRRKEMTLDAVEFMRRFVLHIVPKGLVRIRRYGLLAHRNRGERIALCRSLLGAAAAVSPTAATAAEPTGAIAGPEQSACAAPAPQQIQPGPASSTRIGAGVLVVLISMIASSGDPSSTTPLPAVLATPELVADRCPNCGEGRLQTIWQARRPSWNERQRILIPDSS